MVQAAASVVEVCAVRACALCLSVNSGDVAAGAQDRPAIDRSHLHRGCDRRNSTHSSACLRWSNAYRYIAHQQCLYKDATGRWLSQPDTSIGRARRIHVADKVPRSLGPALTRGVWCRCYGTRGRSCALPGRCWAVCGRVCSAPLVWRAAHLAVCLSMNCFSRMYLPSLYF